MPRFKKTLLSVCISLALSGGGFIHSADANKKAEPSEDVPTTYTDDAAPATDVTGGSLSALKFTYTGAPCSAWYNALASCIDHSFNSANKVHIIAREAHGEQHVAFDGIVPVNANFTMDATNTPGFTFTGDAIEVDIFDLEDNRLQEITLSIADDQLLNEGDAFGGLVLKQVRYKFNPQPYDFSQYIVTFHESVAWSDVQAYAAYWETLGVGISMELPLINGLALELPDHVSAEDLATDPRITAIELNQRYVSGELMTAQGRSFIKSWGRKPEKKEYPWGVLKLYYPPEDHPTINAPADRLDEKRIAHTVSTALEELDDRTIRVAFFDTGIDVESAFTNPKTENNKLVSEQVRGGIDVVNRKFHKKKGFVFPHDIPDDDNGHGTHVAGILAAALDEDYKWGKEAKVEIYGVKVLDQQAVGSLSNVVMGLQWAIDNDIDVVNMSLGYRRDSFATRLAIEEAAKAGLIIVASVGNRSNYDDSIVLEGLSGAGEGGAGEGGAGEGGAGEGGAGEGGAGEGGAGEGGAGEGGAGEGGAGEGGAGEGGAGEGGAGSVAATSIPLYSVMYPARYPEVIAVGASTPSGQLASFSNRGYEMDIMAPGVDIMSADITHANPLEDFGTSNGTSMAAPYVTAAVALMLTLDPTLDVQTIRELLRQTAYYQGNTPVGELNLDGLLAEVMARFAGVDAGAFDRQTLEEQYKEALKERINQVDGPLWD